MRKRKLPCEKFASDVRVPHHAARHRVKLHPANPNRCETSTRKISEPLAKWTMKVIPKGQLAKVPPVKAQKVPKAIFNVAVAVAVVREMVESKGRLRARLRGRTNRDPTSPRAVVVDSITMVAVARVDSEIDPSVPVAAAVFRTRVVATTAVDSVIAGITEMADGPVVAKDSANAIRCPNRLWPISPARQCRVFWNCIPKDTGSCAIRETIMPHRRPTPSCRVR